MSYGRLYLDQASSEFMNKWAQNNGWVIIDSSTPDRASKQQYAADCGGVVVQDPRAGMTGNTLIVKPLQDPA